MLWAGSTHVFVLLLAMEQEVHPASMHTSLPLGYHVPPTCVMFCCLQVEEEVLDASVANLHLYPELQPGQLLPRGKERISLTVR